MAKKRYINTKFWSDTFIVELNPLDRYLFIYLLTNEHTNICGIYELPFRVMARETGLDDEMLQKMFKTLNGKIYYVDGWIYIKNFSKHQAENESVKIGIDRSMKEVPSVILDKIEQINTACTQPVPSLTPSSDILKLKLKLKLKPKLKTISAERKKSNNQLVVEYFFSLKGWSLDEEKNKLLFPRYTRPAKQLLELTEGDIESAKSKLLIIKNWADAQNLDWSIETVFKRWHDLYYLPQEKQKKPRIGNCPAYKKGDTWYVINPNGEHKQWIGSLTEIKYE